MTLSHDLIQCATCGFGVGVWAMHLLGGSWVVISGVISPRIWVTTIVILLIALLVTTHEPPSRVC